MTYIIRFVCHIQGPVNFSGEWGAGNHFFDQIIYTWLRLQSITREKTNETSGPISPGPPDPIHPVPRAGGQASWTGPARCAPLPSDFRLGLVSRGHRQKMRGNRRMQQGFPFLAPWGHLFGGRFAWPNRSSYSAAFSTRIFSFLSLSSSGPCNSISFPHQEWRLHGIPDVISPRHCSIPYVFKPYSHFC